MTRALLFNGVAPTMYEPLIPFDVCGQRVPPTEFRLFKAGENETEKGTFLFDDQAAASVMAAWEKRAIDLMFDYEHASLAESAEPAPASVTRWVPQVRNGELWATEVTWTARAAAYLAAGEYRYFSPAFEFESDTRRITQVINVALTNNPAMHGIQPLVAASKTAKEPRMDFEKLYTETKAALESLRAELSAKDATIAELSSKLSTKANDDKEEEDDEQKLSATLSLRAGASRADRNAAVVSLSALRSNVRQITGADSDGTALGVLHAWKDGAAQVAKLSARVVELETEKLSAEFDALLDEAGKQKKIEPARRDEIRATALKQGGGRLTRESVDTARTYLSMAQPRVNNTPATPPSTPAAGAPHPLEVHIAKVCGQPLPQ